MKPDRHYFVRSLLLIGLSGGLCFEASSQTGLIEDRVVGYGVKHQKYVLPGPFTLNVLEVTLPNPYVRLESFRPHGLVRTSEQAAANDRAGHRVIGAVNGDFFSSAGLPVGNQVVNGLFALGIASSRSHLAIDNRQRPMIERLSFLGTLRSSSGASFPLTGINLSRPAGAIVFYNSYRGGTTSTIGGAECSVELLDSVVAAGDTLRVRLRSVSTGGDMPIAVGGGVLSASPGVAATFLTSNLAPGDTLLLSLGFESRLRPIAHVLGGAGRFLLGGRNVADSMAALEGLNTSFSDVRNPRTFCGFNRDTTKLYVCTVDGRQTSSVGMTFDEMANFMVSLGANDAFNFDGGGSTTMVVRGSIVNSPSDPAGERSVANTLQIISVAPPGTLAGLSISPRCVETFQGAASMFYATGTDEYLDPVPLPPMVIWDVDSRLGTITSGGLFTAHPVNDSGWVRLSWNAVRDSVKVIVHPLNRITPRSPGYVMVSGDHVTMRVLGTTSVGLIVPLDNTRTVFQASSSAITVDALGQVSAAGRGTGILTIDYHGLNAQALFDCTGHDTTIILDAMDRMDDWAIAGVNADADQVAVGLASDPALPGKTVFQIDHSHPPLPMAADFMTTLPLAGLPDSISLRVYGSGNADTVRLVVQDRDGDLFSIAADTVVYWTNSWQELGFHLNHAVPFGLYSLDAPVSISRVQVVLSTNANDLGFVQGVLYLSDMRAHYPHRTGTRISEPEGSTINRYELYQNYPNPFNPKTVVGYSVPSQKGRDLSNVKIAVYDILGREVAVLVDEKKVPGGYKVWLDASGFAGGVYLCRMQSGSGVSCRKMLLLR